MKQIAPLGDDRIQTCCIYCGAVPDSDDHVPSRVLLDEPFPENLPTVPSCRFCNNSFSLDEEYCAAMIDCVLVDSAAPTIRHRPKVRRILERKPALVAMLAAIRSVQADGSTVFAPDLHRVKNVVVKLAKGHAAYELHTVDADEPTTVSIAPLTQLDAVSSETFETPPDHCLYPEIGSRAMMRMVAHGVPSPSWIEIQQGRYRFMASPGLPVVVRIVLSEYLACEVVWNG